ncbi:ficolin-1-like [Asterias amurensis]|uniref:ficolin-1-like n=1 Tax=Asterias amurensis TaxID=7602 RepID=UPI003AB791C9
MDFLRTVLLFLITIHAVVNGSPKTCYFVQEPNHAGKLHWVMPGSHEERCSCAVILPAGLNKMAPKRLIKPYRTDHPLFTDEVKMIHDYFNCHYDKPADCQALLDAGNTESGVYTVSLPNSQELLDVNCEMIDTTGWLVFQRRLNGSVNFTRNWNEYKRGFGNLQGEFWLGNEAVRLLTGLAESNWTIRVDLTDETGVEGSLTKSSFRIVGDEYTLQVGSSELGQIGEWAYITAISNLKERPRNKK